MVGGNIPDDLNDGSEIRPTLTERLRTAFLKPAVPNSSTAGWDEPPLTAEELEEAVASLTDKERIIGLFAAPMAAVIAILITAARVSSNPPALLKNGSVNKAHYSVSLLEELAGVLIVMSILMLVTALMRKRLFLGITTALFGLTAFNLHYWGFGVPFLMVGSWYLVRAYRLQRDLREAGGGSTHSPPSRARGQSYSQPGANKRYTPPVVRTKRPRATHPRDT